MSKGSKQLEINKFMKFELDNYLTNFLLKDYAALKIVNEMIQY